MIHKHSSDMGVDFMANSTGIRTAYLEFHEIQREFGKGLSLLFGRVSSYNFFLQTWN